MKHFVVTIAREYGSQGLAIGRKLAEELGVNYYDRDLVELAAAELDEDVRDIKHVDEIHSVGIANFLRPSGIADNKLLNKVIEVQSRIIRDKAESESCIIIGRCADYVLRDRSDCINVLVCAPFDKRMERIYSCKKADGTLVDRIREEDNIAEVSVEIAAEIKRIDTARDNYYRYVTGYERNKIDGKHIIIDSSLLGVDKTAMVLKEMVIAKFGE